MPPPHGARPDLYGAQPERTALAWQRSLLGVLLGSLLLTVTAVRAEVWLLAVLGALLTVAVVWPLGARGPLRGTRSRQGPAHGLARLVLAVTSLAVLGVALALSRAVGAT